MLAEDWRERISNGSNMSADAMELLTCAHMYPYETMDAMSDVMRRMNSLETMGVGGIAVGDLVAE